ncbi:MAG TPA: hypothetical protein PKE64_15415 [Anaerolineae bacterium]|nr:hypothetical protein [Anaerolineae bacterium]
MPTSQEVDVKIDTLLGVSSQTLKQESDAHYQQLQTEIAELEALAREVFQARLEGLYLSIIQKLEDGQALTTAEHDILEMLVVGEARYYLRVENEVEHWRSELKRLLEELKKQQIAGLDEIDSLMKVRALCRETMRVVPDLAYYFREKERVRSFEQATREAIDLDTRRALANLIKDMMASDKL